MLGNINNEFFVSTREITEAGFTALHPLSSREFWDLVGVLFTELELPK